MAEPLERLTAIFGGPYLIERKPGSGGESSGPRSRAVRLADSHAIPSTPRMDSPLLGGGAVIICDAAGWMLIWGIARLLSAKPDTFLVLTIFWFGQFCWGAALAVYFKRLEMAKARGVVIFVLATAVLMTIGSLILAFLISGGF